MEARKKVFVGMSGGVDSSVSAALLKEAGYDVTGVFIKVWQPDFLTCTWKEDRQDAMRVCALLNIPFLTFDFEEEYKKHVVEYMLEEYKAGRTPNPDVMCNKHIKFDSFFKKAVEMGADFIATGHYARTEKRNGRTALLRGMDSNKDQSYFLWTLSQEVLEHTLFPVGGYQKSEVRAIAEKFSLPVAQKHDSQGLCFLGKLDMKEFLGHYIEPHRGDVLNERGEVIGYHEGAEFYTLGQRHGFTLTKQENAVPLYVVDKDVAANALTVSQDPAHFGTVNKFLLEKVNWIVPAPSHGEKLEAQIRYRGKAEASSVQSVEPCVIEFETAQPTATSGQSIVMYRGEECLGGGIIA